MLYYRYWSNFGAQLSIRSLEKISTPPFACFRFFLTRPALLFQVFDGKYRILEAHEPFDPAAKRSKRMASISSRLSHRCYPAPRELHIAIACPEHLIWYENRGVAC